MAKLTFYPLGNADSILIDTLSDKKILFDFGNERDCENKDDKRCDLAKELRENMQAAKKDTFAVLAITHLDDDHTCGADEFFYFDHDSKRQSKDRFKIDTLWVPASVITEPKTDLHDGGKAIQAEAQYRLKKGYGIRVFSRPERLKKWLEKNGLTLESRREFITDAGNVAKGVTIEDDKVEFFVHCPFAWRQDGSTVIDRNGDSLVMQATFVEGWKETKVIFGSDVPHDVLTEIVLTTKRKKREEKLEWDVFKLPHHCSYTTLSADENPPKTTPDAEVKWLFETQGQQRCIIVSSSNPIPKSGEKKKGNNPPPHRAAFNYYEEDVTTPKKGQFLVTMEHPNEDSPRPLEIKISSSGAELQLRSAAVVVSTLGSYAPRAGRP